MKPPLESISLLVFFGRWLFGGLVGINVLFFSNIVSHFWDTIDWKRKGNMGEQGYKRVLNKYMPQKAIGKTKKATW
jgi:hypothetical protein